MLNDEIDKTFRRAKFKELIQSQDCMYIDGFATPLMYRGLYEPTYIRGDYVIIQSPADWKFRAYFYNSAGRWTRIKGSVSKADRIIKIVNKYKPGKIKINQFIDKKSKFRYSKILKDIVHDDLVVARFMAILAREGNNLTTNIHKPNIRLYYHVRLFLTRSSLRREIALPINKLDGYYDIKPTKYHWALKSNRAVVGPENLTYRIVHTKLRTPLNKTCQKAIRLAIKAHLEQIDLGGKDDR